MKFFSFLFIILFSFSISAQESDEVMVQKAVEAFFEAFHKQDSTAMNSFIASEVKLQSVWKDKKEGHHLRTEEFSKLVESIVSIPDSIVFEEKLFDFNIQVDGLMANVWFPYQFWLNNEFSHCGVNNFQLFKNEEQEWKIIYLIDTRRKAGCLEE